MSRGPTVLHLAAAVLATAGLAATCWRGVQQPAVALAFGLVVVVGELIRVRIPGTDHPVGPLASAGALGYALLGDAGGRPTSHGTVQVIAVVTAATVLGCLAHPLVAGHPGCGGTGPPATPPRTPPRTEPRTATLDHIARRVLAVAFAAVCFQPLYRTGTLERWFGRAGDAPYHALLLLVVLLLTALCDALLGAVLAAGRTGRPVPALLREQLRATVGIVPAIAATGAVIALAVAVAGLGALPVFCVPLLLTQLSFRRYAAVRTTYRQTIVSLARATEVAGYTPPGHAHRVAALSGAVARELRLAEPELTVLEYAALMHDIGQLSLVDPVPDGATEPLAAAERRRIALLGGAVVRQTGVAGDIARVVERQADPYREQPLTARIIRTVNAYEDLAARSPGPADGVTASLWALERLRLGTARDYDPRVVEALSRVVAGGKAA